MSFTALLNRNIIIEKEVTTKNDLGTPVETYHFLKESYAGLRLISGNTQYTDGALPFSQSEFTIRYDDRVDYKCRIKYENNYYKIKHIHYEGREDFIRIITIAWEDS